jgi:hypothetical protein
MNKLLDIIDYVSMFFLTATTSNRGKRGRNKCLELKELCKNGPIRLEIKKGNKGATGKRGGQFTRLVSLIVRDHADLHYASWTKVPHEHMAMLRSRVRVRLSFFEVILYTTNYVIKL